MKRLNCSKRVLLIILVIVLASVLLMAILVLNNKAKVKRRLQAYANYINSSITKVFRQESHERIEYYLADDTITMTSKYGNDELRIRFGRRGPNQIPDIKSISIGSTALYSGGSDAVAMPYTVAALADINGDDTSHHYFTGGNHNYNNTGDPDGGATGRNVSLCFYADGKLLANGDSGNCSSIEIVFKNRIQAYNTRRADGTGREVLEESRTIRFDGSALHLCGSVLPLEDIRVELYYGCGLNIANGWPVIQYIGGENRVKFDYSEHISSGNRKPNGIRCIGEHDRLDLMIDRSFDLGANPLIGADDSGAFCTGLKVYFCLIRDSLLSAGDEYFFKASYEFSPT